MTLTPELIGAMSVGIGGILTAWFGGQAKLKKSYRNNGNNGNQSPYVTKEVFDISEKANRDRHKETLGSIKSLHDKSNETAQKVSEIVGMLSVRKRDSVNDGQ